METKRSSARFIAQKLGLTTTSLYNMWSQMGFVVKDQFGDWILTESGRQNGGKMSNGSHLSVPTFDFESMKKLLSDFGNT